jgi:hypothetical protein
MRFTLCLLAAALAAQTPRPAPATTASFENDYIVINEPHPNVDVPGYSHKAHIHNFSRVMVYMHLGGEYLHYLADGRTEDLKWRPGHVVWSPSNGWHYSEMKPDTPAFTGPMIVDIGVKKAGDPAKAKPAALDPLKVAPKNFTLELENPQVRVLRLKVAPGENVPTVESNLNRLVVYITESDGHKPADFVWQTPGKFKPENKSDKPLEMVIVEFRS